MNKPLEIWIDALDFSEKGGWKEDTQFVHLMGSGYLLAADEPGVPVKDACITVNVPEAGCYRAWVRDRNWLRPHDPGKFSLLVNGHGNGVVLGAMPSDAWVWEIAGDFELAEGPCTIALHDLTGYFGRCASILLTTDLDYTPPREVERIHRERARIKGLPMEVQEGGDYDVIVAGGGPAGVPAAIACAREGVKTLLIQDRPMLGGNASPEIGITMDGAMADHLYARESGIAEEIRRLRDADPSYFGDWSRAMEKLASAEEKLTIVYDRHVMDVEKKDDATIAGVTALDIRTLCRYHYTGRIFVDCTGDGWLGYYAGAKYRYGRESRAEYGEQFAPETADTQTMSGCIKSGNLPYFEKTDQPVEYHAPAWVPELPKTDDEFGRLITGNGARLMWWIEVPGNYDDVWDGEETRDALLLAVLGYYDHIKNYWSKKERIRNYRLSISGIINGRRESRRLIGDYVLTEQDCLEGTTFEDTVTYSGWTLDVHHPKGIYSGKEGPSHVGRHVKLTSLPYRCLYSKNIGNLLFAGRNVSATHIAIGTLRVENTIATIGQAAGTAAALCIRHGESPLGIYERHLWELQQLLLRNDQYIPGVRNEDPLDPCRTASAKASSVSRTERFNTIRGTEGELLPMNVARLATFTTFREDGDVKEVWLKLASTREEPCEVTIHCDNRPASTWSFYEFKYAQSVTAIVPPRWEGWVRFPVDIPLGINPNRSRCPIEVRLNPAKGIFWRALENLSFYENCGEMRPDGRWKMTGACGMCATRKEPELPPANCAPENVINGVSRIVDKDIYEWVSDPSEPLPQWIELDFRETAEINEISLVFDTDLTNPGTCWTVKRPGVPECVKDYEVEVLSDGAWKTVAHEDGNFMRRRVHRFTPERAEAIRVTVFATWGDKSARIMEIRAGLR